MALTSLFTTANAVKAAKASFDTFAGGIRFLMTTGLRFFLQFWYSKTPMFALPQGWAPYPVEWVLSFPRAQLGTVSIQVWGTACAVVVALLGDAITYVVVASASKTQTKKEKVKAGSAATPKATEKKDL